MSDGVVSDSTVLIFLGKLDALDLLREVYPEVLVPERVFHEVVVEGKELGESDAHLVEDAVEEGWIRVEEVEVGPEVERFGLEAGESAALSLALERGAGTVLADEGHVREVAKVLDLVPRGTLFFLLRALETERMDFDGYLESLESLAAAGFYMSDELYFEAVKKGRRITRGREG